MTRFIFITGGVASSLGKGLASAALGALLQARGFTVRLRKFDPYLNVDPGTMSPYQHGEVYVTDDGAETDLDLGHYERFTGVASRNCDSVTAGRIYQRLIHRERRGDFLGGTVQVIPHVTDAIKEAMRAEGEGVDFVLCEIGGTVGDIEGLPFFEAIRQLGNDLGRDRAVFVHLTLVPYISAAQELKTKPTQHSVKELRSIGIQPDILLCRCDQPLPEKERRKIALFCNVREPAVIPALDVDSIYEVPLRYHDEGFDEQILRAFNIESPEPDLSRWTEIVERSSAPEGEIKIAIVGKYTGLQDAYLSLTEALRHGGIANRVRVGLEWYESETFEADDRVHDLDGVHGILVPGGFGERGAEGKIAAVSFARQRGRPLPRHLLRHAARGRRGGAQPGQSPGRRFDGIRALPGSGDRTADGMGRRRGTRGARRKGRSRRHHAAWRLRLRAQARKPGARDIRRAADPRAPPPPL